MAMINNANAVLFDLCTRLKDNGVVAKASGNYEFSEDNISLDFVERISELDFSEHDKRFKDEIRQLKHNADELKENNATVELPFDAIEVANFLINEEYECNIPFVGGKTKCRKYEIEDLEQIAEHLLVYCKHNREY